MGTVRSYLYGLANLAYFLGYSTFNTYVLFFYTEQLAAPARLIGLGWLLFGIWNTLNDLLFGWLSDRTSRRRGGRTFFIRMFALPLALAFWLVWNPPVAIVRPDGILLFL